MKLLIFIVIFVTLCAIVDCAKPKTVQSMKMQRRALNSPKKRFRPAKSNLLSKTIQSSSSTNQLTDYSDFVYIISISVGTPSVSFPVIMDTGSSDLWLASTLCGDCSGISPIYNPKSSTSAANNSGHEVFLGYGSGSLYVSLINDAVCIGTLCYQAQIFGQAVIGASSILTAGLDAGLLGLAWPALASEGTPFVQNILSQLPQQLFTIWLNSVGPFSSTGETTNGGVITFGGLDTTHCSSTINYVPVTLTQNIALGYWQFTISGVAAGTYSQTASSQVISDSGTSLIIGPTNIVASLAAAVGAFADGNFYIMPCVGNYPPIIFTINGIQYSIPSSIYIVDNLGSGYCLFGFEGADLSGDGISWILGDPWIRAFCNVYNIGTKQIGFAQSLTTGAATPTPTTSTKPPTTKLTTTPTKPPTTTTKPPATTTPIKLPTTTTKQLTSGPTSSCQPCPICSSTTGAAPKEQPATPQVNQCQTCPISAMNFTWYRPEAPNDGIVDYAPRVTYSINATTGCAQISLDCTCGGESQVYIFEYSNGVTYNNYVPTPVLFECNGAAQLWQNNYATPSTGAMTATNFICYRSSAITSC